MRRTALLLALALAAAPAAASALLARNSACMSCHALTPGKTRGVGPAMSDIAARYAGDPDAPARLSDRIRLGSSGAWGKALMPANPQVSDADRETLVAWILALPR